MIKKNGINNKVGKIFKNENTENFIFGKEFKFYYNRKRKSQKSVKQEKCDIIYNLHIYFGNKMGEIKLCWELTM